MRNRFFSGIWIPILLACAACTGPSELPPPPPPPPPPAPVFLMLIEGPWEVTIGTPVTFTAVLVNKTDQSRRDVTTEAQWSSSNPALLTVQGNSAVGNALGEARLEARFETWRAESAVLIRPVDPRSGPSPARLVIDALSVAMSSPTSAGYYEYSVKFRLREASGEDSVTIASVVVHGPSGSDETGPGCWRDPVRVPAWGTLDLFETDAGLAWLGYCAPVSGGRTQTPTLRVVVNFIDDHGRSGQAEAVVTASR